VLPSAASASLWRGGADMPDHARRNLSNRPPPRSMVCQDHERSARRGNGPKLSARTLRLLSDIEIQNVLRVLSHAPTVREESPRVVIRSV
jgi:hypothetical protein